MLYIIWGTLDNEHTLINPSTVRYACDGLTLKACCANDLTRGSQPF